LYTYDVVGVINEVYIFSHVLRRIIGLENNKPYTGTE